MPAASKRQLRYLFANKPALGKEFADATPNIKALPERAGKGAALQRARAKSAHRRHRRKR